MVDCSEKQIHVQYYAILREQRGISTETLRTSADTVREFYEELKRQYGFSLGTDRLSIAINDDFADWDRQLKDSDSLVFIPPVAGG